MQNPISDIINNQEDVILSGVADGMEGLVLADLARARKKPDCVWCLLREMAIDCR